jgi:hypothetical protein
MFATYPGMSMTNWRSYTRSEFGLYQYNQEDLSPLSENLVKVRQKLILSEIGTAYLARELGKEYENVKEIITLREIDCAGKRNRILEILYCSEEGMVIKKASYEPTEWDSIISDSVDDILHHTICE